MYDLIRQALDLHLIPPLINLVFEYLVVTYTLELTEEHLSQTGSDLQVRCEITPLRNHFKGTYITKLCDDGVGPSADQLKHLQSLGWTLTLGFQDVQFATKTFEGSPENFETFAEAVAADPAYSCDYNWTVHTILTSNEGFSEKGVSEGRYRSGVEFVECLEKFVTAVASGALEINVPKVWHLLEIAPSE